MIEISTPTVGNNNCLGCDNDNAELDRIADILISNRGKRNKLSLCKDCREQLMKVLQDLDLF
jgi:hypothetical protein